MSDPALEAARGGDGAAFARLMEPHKRELLAHCYRMSGSMGDAEDLLQESLIRAWKGLATFEGRSSLRTWLYRVTTHACLDTLDKRGARVLPTDLGPAADPRTPPPPPRYDESWLEPCSRDIEDATETSPEARLDAKQSVALAFLSALQQLPPKQRAVLLLRDVLGWEASACAELLELSVPAVNSALQRARESVPTRQSSRLATAADAETEALLVRYVRAWEGSDVHAFVALLHEDATLSMAPFAFWLVGAEAIGASLAAMVLTDAARGNWRLVATRANGCPAYLGYERDASGAFQLKALHVLDLDAGRVRALTAFLDPRSFASLGAPASLNA
jgi:RNA polymerase sigma-70 factor (ECF subfamily)